ncbi:MAG: type II toxin-antitoxin system Phd/YefM family antitoxin [Terriglobia bacterium]
MEPKLKMITATEFKAKCLHILDHLGPQGLTITKRGKPVARVTPMTSSSFDRLYGSMKGKITGKGDIFSTGRKWNAQSGKW